MKNFQQNMAAIFIFLLINPAYLIKADSACGDLLVSPETTYNCNNPVFSQTSLPNLPLRGKIIYLQTEIKVISQCSGTTLNLATLTIEPSSGSPINLINIVWNGSQDALFSTEDTSGVKDIMTTQSMDPEPFGTWFSFTVRVRLDTNEASIYFVFPGIVLENNHYAVITYDPSWTIDMAPKIYPCSDESGINKIVCSIKNLKVWYQGASVISDLTLGTTPALIAQYRLNQYNGFEVTNSVTNGLGPAYFGSSASSVEDPVAANKPSWVPKIDAVSNKLLGYSGIVFDQTSQYVTIPTFPLGQSLMVGAYTITIKIWVKLSSNPGLPGYLFRYARASFVSDILALRVETDRTASIINYGATVSSSSSLSATNWNSIIATFASLNFFDDKTGITYYGWVTTLINNSPDISTIQVFNNLYSHEPSNIVRLGGPPTVLGIIAGVEIYSPGSNYMTGDTACQASICQRDLGITTPSTCILPICSANCAGCFNSQQGSCLACNPGYSLYESQCIAYPCGSGEALDSTTNTCVINANSCDNPLNFYYPVEKYCRPTCTYPFKIVPGSPLQNCVLDISEADAAQAQNVATASTITNYATNFGGAVLGLISSSNFGLVLMQSLTQMLSYIQYLNIDYPPKVYLMLQQQNVNSGGLSIITQIPSEVAEAIPNHPLPEVFAQNDTHSSFVANSWAFIISLSGILLSIGIILFFNTLLKKAPKIEFFISKLLHSLRWNLFFGMFCSGYGFTGIFTALEFRTVNMGAILSIMSFIICLIVNTLGFFTMYIVFQICLTFRTIKKSVKNPEEQTKRIEEAEKEWKSYAALFDDYKSDHMSQQLFWFIFMIRTYIHYSILGYLNEYPLFQTCCLTVISIVIVLYLIIRRPMKSKMNYAQQILCEVALLVVNINVMILASMDKWIIADIEKRAKVGDVIVSVNLGLSIASSVFTIYGTLSQIKEGYLYIKSWLQSNKGLKSQSKKAIKEFIKSYKVRTARSKNINPDHHMEELEISSIDKSNDISIDQLKPH